MLGVGYTVERFPIIMQCVRRMLDAKVARALRARASDRKARVVHAARARSARATFNTMF